VAAPRFLALAALAVAFIPGSALAGDAAGAHQTWRECLGHAYLTGAAYTGRDLAADAAIRACRGEETAYLAALSTSPLLDEDDMAQARPQLIARARAQLLAMVNTGPRPVLR
jgi:hypothetical protein